MDGDAFLKAEGSDKLFTNPTLHAILEQLTMTRTPVSAPKMAFVLMKIMEALAHPRGFNRGRDVATDDSDNPEDTYQIVLALTLKHAGTQCWAIHQVTGPRSAPKPSWILIRKDAEVSWVIQWLLA